MELRLENEHILIVSKGLILSQEYVDYTTIRVHNNHLFVNNTVFNLKNFKKLYINYRKVNLPTFVYNIKQIEFIANKWCGKGE